MAKATLIFTDSDDGTVNVSIEFDPPAQRDVPLTAAQMGAFSALENLRNDASEWTQYSDGEEDEE